MNKKIAIIVGTLILALSANAIVIPVPATGAVVNQHLISVRKNNSSAKEDNSNSKGILYFLGSVGLVIGLLGIMEIILDD